MRGHFRYLRFKTFPMTPRTPQCEVFFPLLSSSEHSGVLEDSKSPLFQVLGFTLTLDQVRVATWIPSSTNQYGGHWLRIAWGSFLGISGKTMHVTCMGKLFGQSGKTMHVTCNVLLNKKQSHSNFNDMCCDRFDSLYPHSIA